jgi:hypothetical protein
MIMNKLSRLETVIKLVERKLIQTEAVAVLNISVIVD